MDESTPARGGPRKGAGRKPKQGSRRNGGVTITITLTPEQAELVDSARALAGKSRAELLIAAAQTELAAALTRRSAPCSHPNIQITDTGFTCPICKESIHL